MFTTHPVDLKDILRRVASGQIQLPDFQREWVWDDDRIRGLLASISRGFPVGAVMTLEAVDDIRLKPRVLEGVSENVAGELEAYLLDGQQRLTSLYQALWHSGPVSTRDRRSKNITRRYFVDMVAATDGFTDREEAIISLPEDGIIRAAFGRETGLDLSSREKQYSEHHFPTEALLDWEDWLLGYVSYWQNTGSNHPRGNAPEFFRLFREEVAENFRSYKLPVIGLLKSTPKEAVSKVFRRVNTGGVKLDTFDLVQATFAVDAGEEGFSLRDNWKERTNRLFSRWPVLKGVDGDNFLQVIALLATQEIRRQAERHNPDALRLPPVGCKEDDVLKLQLGDYQNWADKAENGFGQAGAFLQQQYIYSADNVPYSTQLVSLAALFVELGREAESAIARQRLEQWYWTGVLGEIYSGPTETLLAQDLVEVAVYVRTGIEPRSFAEASFQPDRLVSLRTRTSAAYKGVYALQLKNHAKDWRTGNELAFADYHDLNIDIHHIFPVAWCKRQPEAIDRKLYDSIINKTPIDARTNRIIGGKAPSEYLKQLQAHVPEGQLRGILESHWIGIGDLESDDFVKSFVARGQHMLDLIAAAMGKTVVDSRETLREALKREGATDYLDDDPEYDDMGEGQQEPDAA